MEQTQRPEDYSDDGSMDDDWPAPGRIAPGAADGAGVDAPLLPIVASAARKDPAVDPGSRHYKVAAGLFAAAAALGYIAWTLEGKDGAVKAASAAILCLLIGASAACSPVPDWTAPGPVDLEQAVSRHVRAAGALGAFIKEVVGYELIDRDRPVGHATGPGGGNAPLIRAAIAARARALIRRVEASEVSITQATGGAGMRSEYAEVNTLLEGYMVHLRALSEGPYCGLPASAEDAAAAAAWVEVSETALHEIEGGFERLPHGAVDGQREAEAFPGVGSAGIASTSRPDSRDSDDEAQCRTGMVAWITAFVTDTCGPPHSTSETQPGRAPDRAGDAGVPWLRVADRGSERLPSSINGDCGM